MNIKELENFELKNGERERTENENGAVLEEVIYGDVTNDGVDEAIVTIIPDTGGDCSCQMVYIYAIANGIEKKTPLLGIRLGRSSSRWFEEYICRQRRIDISTFRRQ